MGAPQFFRPIRELNDNQFKLLVSETAYYWRTNPLTLKQLTISELMRWRNDLVIIHAQRVEASKRKT